MVISINLRVGSFIMKNKKLLYFSNLFVLHGEQSSQFGPTRNPKVGLKSFKHFRLTLNLNSLLVFTGSQV